MGYLSNINEEVLWKIMTITALQDKILGCCIVSQATRITSELFRRRV